MDLLSELLSEVRIAASAIGRFTLRAPFHLRFDYEPPSSFVVLSGRCGWQRGSGPVRWLGPGDAMLGWRDTRFALASDFGQPAVSMDAVAAALGLTGSRVPREMVEPMRVALDGPEPGCELLAIAYAFESRLGHPLLHAMPDDLHIPAAGRSQGAAVEGAVAFINAESEAGRPGYAAMAAHLGETLFLGLLRAYALQGGDIGWGGLRALHDARLRKALTALHADPAHAWTVQSLAQIAAMSRSVFAQRFASSLGMPPMAYVAALRMHLAQRRLQAGPVPIGRLAEDMGYRSERAFRKAFERSAGSSPRAWQRQRQGER